MLEENISLDISYLFKLFYKNLMFIFVLSFVFAIGAYLATSMLMSKKYDSVIKLYVDSPLGTSVQTTSEINSALSYTQRVVNTYIEMLNTNTFYNQVRVESGLDYSAGQIKSMVSYSILSNTEIFQVKVTSQSPQNSKEIAETISKVAPIIISDLQENAQLKVVDEATFKSEPSSPNVRTNVMVGFMLGFIISVGFIFIKDFLDTSVKSEYDLSLKYDIPVIVGVPDFDIVTSAKKNKNNRGEFLDEKKEEAS